MFLHQDRLNFSMDACLLEGIDVEERKSERFEKKYRKVYIYIIKFGQILFPKRGIKHFRNDFDDVGSSRNN